MIASMSFSEGGGLLGGVYGIFLSRSEGEPSVRRRAAGNQLNGLGGSSLDISLRSCSANGTRRLAYCNKRNGLCKPSSHHSFGERGRRVMLQLQKLRVES